MKREIYVFAKRIWKEYNKYYCLLFCSFVIGFLLALCMPISSSADLKTYITTFLEQLRVDKIYGVETFVSVMKQHMMFICGMYLLSLSAVGVPGTLLYTSIKGFCYGKVLVGIVSSHGAKTILFFLCGFIPHLLFLIPFCFAYSGYCIKNACSVFAAKCNVKNNIMIPGLYSLLFIPGFAFISLIQTYVEPWLLLLTSAHIL